MGNVKIAICDDEPLFIQRATELIERWAQETKSYVNIYRFHNGEDFLTESAHFHFDLLLLDILMPRVSGMEIAKEIRKSNQNVSIVFLTSSKEFAIESYEVKAQGYLLKPVSYNKLKEVLDEVLERMETKSKYLVIRTSLYYQKLYHYEIEFIEAQNKKLIFHTVSGNEYIVSETFSVYEKKLLQEEKFFKCHRSYLVYLPNIDHFNSSEIIMKSGKQIPIARGKAKQLKEAYFAILFD